MNGYKPKIIGTTWPFYRVISDHFRVALAQCELPQRIVYEYESRRLLRTLDDDAIDQ